MFLCFVLFCFVFCVFVFVFVALFFVRLHSLLFNKFLIEVEAALESDQKFSVQKSPGKLACNWQRIGLTTPLVRNLKISLKKLPIV